MRTRAAGSSRRTVRRQLLVFYGVAALVMVVISFGAVIASRSVARGAALQDAERVTTRMANLVIGPLLNRALSGDADDLRQLDRSVDARMRDGYLVQVTVWNAAGAVVYADDERVVGRSFPAPPEVAAALQRGKVSSGFASAPEATMEKFQLANTNFVEVYVPLVLPGRDPLVFEAYYDYARVTEIADSLLWQIIPLVLVPLVLLQVIQLPIAASLAHRIRRQDKERTALLEQTLSVSDKERMRIAANLHDGSIQDLAGISYALAAIAPGVAERDRPLLGVIQDAVLRANESLRRLMVEVYPPDLSAAQLPTTIADLAVPLREQGIEVTVAVEELPDLSGDAVTTLYRVAREAMLNIVEHSRATEVTITLGRCEVPPDGVLLVIDDNGVGLDVGHLDRRAQGHLGLRLLRDRVAHLGGSMTFASGLSGGTAVSVRLPGRSRRKGADHQDRPVGPVAVAGGSTAGSGGTLELNLRRHSPR